MVRPGDPEGRLFSYVVSGASQIGTAMPAPARALGQGIWRAVTAVFFTISPAVPVDLQRVVGRVRVRRLVVGAFAAGILFSLGFNLLFAWLSGTLTGIDPGRIYLLQDRWNLVLYAAVTPTYTALAMWLIVLTIQHWSRLAEFRAAVAQPESRARHLGVGLAVAFALSALLITTYVKDALDPGVIEPTYWFVSTIGEFRTLNRAGYYYLLLNFALLFLTLLAIGAFFALAVEVVRVGHDLGKGVVGSFEELRDQLETFTTGYLIAKLLAATYMINAFIWQASPLSGTNNIVVAGLAITIVGVFFIALPRLYVELKWFQFRLVADQHSDAREDLYQDIRSPQVRLWAHVLDVTLIGGFVVKFWGLDQAVGTMLRRIGF